MPDTMPDTMPDIYVAREPTSLTPRQIDWYCEDVLRKVQQINNEFDIVVSHIEDYDDGGAMIEVECVNGWVGWSWEMDNKIKKRKKELYNSIIKGCFINEKGEKITDISDMVHTWIFGNDRI